MFSHSLKTSALWNCAWNKVKHPQRVLNVLFLCWRGTTVFTNISFKIKGMALQVQLREKQPSKASVELTTCSRDGCPCQGNFLSLWKAFKRQKETKPNGVRPLKQKEKLPWTPLFCFFLFCKTDLSVSTQQTTQQAHLINCRRVNQPVYFMYK